MYIMILIQFKFICIALFYFIFSNSLSVVSQVDVHMAEMYDKNQAVS